MIVDYTPEALANLIEIWDWNAEQYGWVHADSYVEFLRKRTDRLSTDYTCGKPVPTNPKLFYRVIFTPPKTGRTTSDKREAE